MRISDWSSDVCSSDLGHAGAVAAAGGEGFKRGGEGVGRGIDRLEAQCDPGLPAEAGVDARRQRVGDRMAEHGVVGFGHGGPLCMECRGAASMFVPPRGFSAWKIGRGWVWKARVRLCGFLWSTSLDKNKIRVYI